MTRKRKGLKRDRESILIGIAAISIVVGIVTGWLAYSYSFKSILGYSKDRLADKVSHLAMWGERSISDGEPGEWYSGLENHWREYSRIPADEYICVVGSDSTLLWHSKDRETIGEYVGNNRIYGARNRSETCLADLVTGNKYYTGDYISSNGETQIASFAPLTGQEMIIGIYRSRQAVHQEINSNLKVLLYMIILVFGVLFPSTLLFFYSSMKKSQREKIETIKKLSDSESSLGAFLENSISGCYIYQDNQFKFVNSRFLEMIGFENFEDFSSDFSISDIIPGEGVTTLKDILIKQMDGTVEHFQNTARLKRKDGKSQWIEIYSNRIEFNGNPASFGIIVDITSRKESEDQFEEYKANLENSMKERTLEIEEQMNKLNKSQKAMLFMIEDLNRTSMQLKNAQDELLLKERLAVLGQFSGSISHELRNPLSVIDSSTFYLRSTLKNQDKKITDHLDRIKMGIRTSTSIIESLLNLTRMKKPVLEPNNLTELIEQSISEVRTPDNIVIRKEIAGKSLVVDCEALQIKIALKNLLKNGIESISGSGELTVTADGADNGEIIVTISDTGIGISGDDLKKIFQPLFTMKAKGIGFGLPITKMIIENHGGRIGVESTHGKGTQFTVILPASEKNG